MLGKYYSLSRECCGIQLTKSRMVNIKLESQVVQTEQTLTTIQIPQGQQLYGQGNAFYNTYTNYCFVVPMVCCSRNTVEIEMNNMKVTETKIPNCCSCLGPYPVENRRDEQIGELRPKCYICHIFWGFSNCHPCCMSLDIYDKNMNKVYVVNREPWTCFCCTKWNVADIASQIKGEIQMSGFCCPNLAIKLPNDTEDNKKLVLSAVHFLP